MTEAAWQHRFPGTGSKIVTARRSGKPALVVALAEKLLSGYTRSFVIYSKEEKLLR
ncbi:hypothetical protein LEP1GSC073_2352 [Leptospira noguchii str. Cascata]|nr:hypothetical protein LEP1GSC073_2352 [Leptospira noguchii str. Cascata]